VTPASSVIAAELWSRLSERVQSALPVPDLDALLAEVAAAWLEVTGAAADAAGPAAAGGFAARLQEAKLQSLAEFAAGAGHEINNPLAAISGRVQLLLRDETDPQRRQALATIGGQALRIRDMIGDLMLFARAPEPHPEQQDAAGILREVAVAFTNDAETRGCTIAVEAADAVPIWADPTQLRVVLSSLLQNSLEASHHGGPITLAAREFDNIGDDGRRITVVSVADHGCGLSDSDRAHLFDPFYSGRQAGRGLGFGLCKCWRIVSNHRGRIEVDSTPAADGTGRTTFRVYWPSAARE
jgi:signal transduction histidine kinase